MGLGVRKMGITRIYSDEMVYSAIVKFIDEKRYHPSVRELSKIVSNASTSTIHARLKSLQAKGYIKTISGAKRTIQINDTMDAVEVVRCQDCKHWKNEINGCTEDKRFCDIGFYMVHKNGFCSFGERKTNEFER